MTLKPAIRAFVTSFVAFEESEERRQANNSRRPMFGKTIGAHFFRSSRYATPRSLALRVSRAATGPPACQPAASDLHF